VVRALRVVLPTGATVHHCANEVSEPGPRGAKRQAILVGMGVHPGFADLMVLCDTRYVRALSRLFATPAPGSDFHQTVTKTKQNCYALPLVGAWL